jgi:phosphoserine phosphatase
MDWDDTLCPDTISGFLNNLGFVPETYWEPLDQLVHEGWDIVSAYMKGLVDLLGNHPNAKSLLTNYAKSHTPFPGVEDLIENLKREMPPKTQLHTFILSSGLKTLIQHIPCSHQFDHLIASDLAFDEDGNILFPKMVFSKDDKARLIQDLCRGQANTQRWSQIQKDCPTIPPHQILFLGDGYTDIPCFQWIKENGGNAIAIYNQEKVETIKRAENFLHKGLVQHIANADYQRSEPLFKLIIQKMKQRFESKGTAPNINANGSREHL